MEQDNFDRPDNQGRPDREPRRDGDRPAFGRRDDDRRDNRASSPRGDDNKPRPSFDRRDDKPRFGGAREDKPRFERGSYGQRDTDRRDDKPRFGGPRDDDRRDSRPSVNRDDKPRFDRDSKPRFERYDKPRFERDSRPPFNREDKPRFDRDSRPSFNRDDKPRFDRDSKPSFNRDDRPRFGNDRRGGEDRRSDGPPRFNRDSRPSFDQRDDKPRFERDSRPAFNREDKPRFERDSRPSFSRDDKPRFDRDNRPSGDRRDDKPRFDRDSKPRFERDDKPRFERDSRPPFNREDKPRFDRDSRPAFNRDDKPRFDRDSKPQFERGNKPAYNRDEKPRFDRDKTSEPRTPRTGGLSSSDRRTGRFDKAPNYNLDVVRKNLPKAKRAVVNKRDEETSKGTAEPGQMRLNRYIANAGVCSRREADELIARGDIQVNSNVITEMGYKVMPTDVVKYGSKVLNPEKMVYVLLNKPKDYLTTTDDPEERRTVMELVADAGPFRIYPVGRLDRNTTGLLLMTNDGELADKLTHPSNNIRKIYQVELDKPITEEHFEALKQGVELEDGLIKPDELSIVTPDAHVIGIEIHSGRNRIVRRMFEHLGYEVTKLDRTTFAGLTKKELPRGTWRFLDPKEVVKLKFF